MMPKGMSKHYIWHIMLTFLMLCTILRAPEILTRSGHGKAVDWWSLGALMFDMLIGQVNTARH